MRGYIAAIVGIFVCIATLTAQAPLRLTSTTGVPAPDGSGARAAAIAGIA